MFLVIFLRCFWKVFGDIFGMFWNVFGDLLGIFWNGFSDLLVMFLELFGGLFGGFWDVFGDLVGDISCAPPPQLRVGLIFSYTDNGRYWFGITNTALITYVFLISEGLE